MKLGILGGGQLGMMMCQEAKDLKISTFIFTDAEDSPATKFSDEHIIAQYDDFEKLERFIMACDVVTYEFENIPYKTLNHILKKKPVYPDPQINNIIQDRLTEKKFINDLNIPTVPYLPIEESNQLQFVEEKFFPAILKTRRLGYDGKGQTVIDSKSEKFQIEKNDYILEKRIELKTEISVITVRYQDNSLFSYKPIENIHKDQILYTSTSPASISIELQTKAIRWSQDIIEALNYVGVICIEFFIDRFDNLYVNEIAPRVHNSGHLTIESYNVSQFQSHLRAVCDLNPIAPELKTKAQMLNLLGDDIFKYRDQSKIEKDAFFHDYYKKEAKKGRKMGHVTKIISQI
jgi:5-(carboxyamino)imidazole ribonucleotide synthase